MSELEKKRLQREKKKKVVEAKTWKVFYVFALPFMFVMFLLIMINEKQSDYIQYVLLKGTPILNVLLPLYFIYVVIAYLVLKKRGGK